LERRKLKKYFYLIFAGALVGISLVLYFSFAPSHSRFTGFDLSGIIGGGYRGNSPQIPSSSPGQPPSYLPRPGAPLIALVIDDNGYSLEQSRAFISLPFPLTLSVLPSLEYSRKVAQEALKGGKEVILHCPMESYQGNEWLGPGAVLTSMSDEEIRAQIEADLYDVPGASGVNNHMGTKATEDSRVMRALLSYLQDRKLFFLDSRVTSASKAEEVGMELGTLVLKNDLSLDHEPDPKAIREKMKRLKEIARHKGMAIGIAHVYTRNLLPLIQEGIASWEEEGFKLVRLSEVIPYLQSPSGGSP
jgi:hypothetical protein